MRDAAFNFVMEFGSEPLPVEAKEQLFKLATHYGATARVEKRGDCWCFVAAFTSDEACKRFVKVWEQLGFRVGAEKQDIDAIRNNIPKEFRKAFDEGVRGAKAGK
jgi:hypothetical protein